MIFYFSFILAYFAFETNTRRDAQKYIQVHGQMIIEPQLYNY